MQYSLTENHLGRSLVLMFDDGSTSTVPDTHTNFDRIVDAVRFGQPEQEVVRLLDAATTIGVEMRRLSERVSYANGHLFFDGDEINTSLSRHIVRMIREGDESYGSAVKFMENLAANPSPRSRRQLWRWLQERDFTLTPDGCFVGYKGVQNCDENLSVTAGANTVYVNGVANTGNIPNPLGATVEMARARVDDDKEVGCSQGLHVGTYDYASHFGDKLLICAVNPRDVVSVPQDCNFQKIRTCRYTVLDARPLELHETTYHYPVFEDDDDDEWDDDRCPDCDEPYDECVCDDEDEDGEYRP